MYQQTVALNNVKFYAFHGFYAEEQLTGSHFLVNAEVTFVPTGDTEDLQYTVNYEVINEILIVQMQNTQKLLETVVKNIMNDLIAKYPFISTAKIGINKIRPTMPGEVGSSFVELKYKG